MYYVYEFYIEDTGEIIYAGKGTGRRYLVRSKRNRLLTEMFSKYKCSSRIVKYFENERDAFEYEYNYINKLKERGECSCNMYVGGAGGSVEYWTEELRQQYSQNNIMKSPEQRLRMSVNNPMKNPDVAKMVAEKKSRPVIIGDIEYSSVKEAHETLGATTAAIENWCKKGINSVGQKCRYKDSEQVEFVGKRYNKGGCKAILYNGKEYESPLDVADELGMSASAIYAWAKRGFSPEGVPCRYVNDETEHVYENRHAKRNRNRARKIFVNGVLYNSCADASEKLNVPKSTLYSYLQGIKHNHNYICKYDDQQPSQGNTDNSTLEGSETNG